MEPVENPVVKATALTVDFTTMTYGGRYGPPNIGAVWVEDQAGKWVHTLEMWCGWLNFAINMGRYSSVGGPDYSAGLFPGTWTSGTDPPPDVIASPTLTNHKAHTGAKWTFTGSRGTEVPDGMYKLVFEFTEQDDPGKIMEVPFMKGGPAGPVEVDKLVTGFSNVKITLQ